MKALRITEIGTQNGMPSTGGLERFFNNGIHPLIFATFLEFKKLKNLLLWCAIWMILNRSLFQACFRSFLEGILNMF